MLLHRQQMPLVLLVPRYPLVNNPTGDDCDVQPLEALHTKLTLGRLSHVPRYIQGYPYVRPSSSFLYLSGAPFTFDDAAWQGANHIQELAVTSPTGEHTRCDMQYAFCLRKGLQCRLKAPFFQ